MVHRANTLARREMSFIGENPICTGYQTSILPLHLDVLDTSTVGVFLLISPLSALYRL